MPRTKSEKYFHVKPENLNCAQSILKGFQNELSVPENLIEEFRACGGGRAANGVCGALHAAEHLLEKANKDSIKNEFEKEIGAITCIEIKREKKTACETCVRIADELLEKKLKTEN